MSSLWWDIRYAIRLWGRSPGSIVIVVLTLALGIGANTTMFSVVNATVLRPLPFPDPDRLQTVWNSSVQDPTDINIVSFPNYRDWIARNRSFESLALFDSSGRGYNLTGGGEPEQVSGVRVSASFFHVLGVEPMLGRTFRPDEEAPGKDHVVVLSHGLWTRRYGADRSLVGRTIPIDGTAYTVVGVMPASFSFQFWSGERQLWVPAGWTAGDQDRGSNSFICIGRLRNGVRLESAQAEMDTIGRALARAYPEANAGQTVRVIPVTTYGAQRLRPVMFALLGTVAFVLLIACVNVANLMLARSAARQTELAIRRAIGAGQGRITRQLLTESVLLALTGGAAGIVLAAWGVTALPAVLPMLRGIPLRPVDQIPIDLPVLAFTFAVATATGILSGLAPVATASRSSMVDPLKDGGRHTASRARTRLRYSLVSAEVALTLVVLACAGMMIASVARLLGVDPGLDTRNVLAMWMSQPQEDLYYGPPVHTWFCQSLEQQVGSVPGVLSVSAISHLPLSGGSAGRSVGVEGRPDPGPEKRPGGRYGVVCPGLLKTLGIPLLAGRDFTNRDVVGAPGVVLINDAMARALWPGEAAVGKRFKIGAVGSEAPFLTVVGVFRSFRHEGLDDEMRPMFFRPFAQAGWPLLAIVVKTAAAPAAFLTPVKKALAIIEPTQPVSDASTMDEVLAGSTAPRRYPMLLLTAFALLALVLAAVGIAGVVGYTVAQRSQEIGVRMALGAQRRDVLRLVVGQSMVWMGAGLGVGLAAAIVVARFMGSLLFNVSPTDPTVLAAASVMLAAVAGGASAIPARRAAAVDPLRALRYE
jgi:putative ABC transport system permease protein